MPVVPTHPVTTPDPAVLRWVVPDGLLPFTGSVARAPRMLQALLDDGSSYPIAERRSREIKQSFELTL